MSRWFWRTRRFFTRQRALCDALEEAYADCTRLRRERDALNDQLYLARLEHAPRSLP